MSLVEFRVVGTPSPQGGMKPVPTKAGVRMVSTGGVNLKSWRAALADEIAAARAQVGRCLTGPLFVEVVFRFAMPKSRSRAARMAGTIWHRVTPDADKLERALGDALREAALIRDDALIARWHVLKVEVWERWTGVVVRIDEMGESTNLPGWCE